jgi:hypothetical protein
MSKQFWSWQELCRETTMSESTLRRWIDQGIFSMMGETRRYVNARNRARLMAHMASGAGPRIVVRREGMAVLDPDTVPRRWDAVFDWCRAFDSLEGVIIGKTAYLWDRTWLARDMEPGESLPTDLKRSDLLSLRFGLVDPRRQRQKPRRNVAQT